MSYDEVCIFSQGHCTDVPCLIWFPPNGKAPHVTAQMPKDESVEVGGAQVAATGHSFSAVDICRLGWVKTIIANQEVPHSAAGVVSQVSGISENTNPAARKQTKPRKISLDPKCRSACWD